MRDKWLNFQGLGLNLAALPSILRADVVKQGDQKFE